MIAARIAVLVLLAVGLLPLCAHAQPAAYTANCTGAGCHVTPSNPYPAQFNGANSSSVVNAAIAGGMIADPGLNGAEMTAIIDYINGALPATPTRSIPFQSAATFPLIGITVPSPYANVNAISTVAPPPTKGGVSYGTSPAEFTYTPNACQVGADSFTFHGTGSGTTSTRTQPVNILNPVIGPTVSAAAPPAGQTGVSYSHSFTVTACSGLVTSFQVASGTFPTGLTLQSTGAVTGTPTATGTFNFTVSATYTSSVTGPTQAFSITIGLGPPVISSAATAPASAVGVLFSGYTITASNTPLTSFALQSGSLPPGLTLNTGSGAITGTPTSAAGSPYVANLTATNATATSAPKAVTFHVAPAINSGAAPSGQTGVAFSYQITGGAGPAYTSYAIASGTLPPGLTLNTGTGAITGTPTTVGGPTNVQFTGSTPFATSAQFTVAFTITLGPPVITSLLVATGGEAILFTPYQITATNSPLTSFSAAPLPTGLTMSPTGLITGTPGSGTAGLYPVSICATNATTSGCATLNLTISQFAPVNTSLVAPAGQTGVPYSFQITANNGPTSFNAANLPPGLSVNTGTGLISGTPSAVGTFNTATITSSNGSGSDTDPVTFNITLGPPVISSPATAGGAVGFAFSYQIAASNSPTLYAISNVPPGLTLNTGTGLLSGLPTTNGVYAGTMSATNGTATDTQPLTITIAVGIPVVTSGSASAATGTGFSYQIVATNGPTSYSAAGLPAGLTLNTATGRITGTPTASGSFPVSLGATNGTGTGTGTLALTIALSPPTTGNALVTVNVNPGQSFQYVIPAENGPFTFTAPGLPGGLGLDPNSGIINGTVNALGGTYDVPITITNASGTTGFTLRFIVGFVIARVADANVDVPFETATPVTLPVTGQVFTVNVVTLPGHGLVTTQPNSAIVTYTPATGFSGFDSFSYSVTNPAGVSTVATVNITVGTSIPVAQAGTMTVQLNTPTILDMSKFVRGSQLTGVAVTTNPTHGTATVNGLFITYTPRTNYFGNDAFSYVAFGDAGRSQSATIQVTITGRPDPTQDREVLGLIDAQSQAARRFAAAQVGNYQRRMESLHVAPPAAGPTTAALAPRTAAWSQPAARLAAFGGGDAPPEESSPLIPISLVSALMNVATTRSYDVAASTGAGGVPAAMSPQTNIWVAGTANFGSREATENRDRLRFSTDGVSAGVDRRFSMRWAGGLGVGYGRDDSDVAAHSHLKSTAGSVAAYASYQPAPRTFIDMLVGYGQLRFDSRRYVEAAELYADGRRKGSQVFGSIGAGYEARQENLLVSPYGRVDFSFDRLEAVSETGAGNFALRYDETRQRSVQAAAGVRVESKHATEFGFAMPRARIEYRRELQDERAVRLGYADLAGGPEYNVTPAGVSRNSLLLGIGIDIAFGGGLKIGVDYTAQRASGASNVQGVRLLVSQELDAIAGPNWRWEPTTFKDPINVDAGFAWDDNATRGRESGDKYRDRSFNLGLSQTRSFSLNPNTRFVVTGLGNAEKFDRYSGLSRFAAGAQGELQYRTSGAFDAMTFGFVGRAVYEKFESSLRTGPRYFAGVNTRRAITDRIEAFVEAGASRRDGRSEVFNWRDWSAKMNLDWSIGKGLVYLTGEYRKGDTVSSGRPSLVNIGLTDVFTADDAFDGLDLVSYRFDARTVMGTLGYNHPLGARDSIDFSWRRIEATPTRHPGFDFNGPLRYIDNQYSIVYLMRF
ncbi:MAG: putative Ig domain-containing protein [Usitatibacter sp.]